MYKSATFRNVFETFSINYREFLNKDFLDFPENTIANKIRKIRYFTGLSQVNFGKKINRCEYTIFAWETGIFEPTLISRKILIKTFNLPKDYFN